MSEKDGSSVSDVRQLDSSGYLSVAPGSGTEPDSNSQESNQQSFLSYLQDHANATVNSGTGGNFYNLHQKSCIQV